MTIGIPQIFKNANSISASSRAYSLKLYVSVNYEFGSTAFLAINWGIFYFFAIYSLSPRFVCTRIQHFRWKLCKNVCSIMACSCVFGLKKIEGSNPAWTLGQTTDDWCPNWKSINSNNDLGEKLGKGRKRKTSKMRSATKLGCVYKSWLINFWQMSPKSFGNFCGK